MRLAFEGVVGHRHQGVDDRHRMRKSLLVGQAEEEDNCTTLKEKPVAISVT
jgi:hypothetical protein